MRFLILSRHAQAQNGGVCDAERSLTATGLAQAEGLGRALEASRWEFELIMASLACRAQETANAVSDLSGVKVEKMPGLYFKSAIQIVEEIQSWDNHNQKVMVVGHNPTITELVRGLSGKDVGCLDTAEAWRLGFDEDFWSKIGMTNCILCEKLKGYKK